MKTYTFKLPKNNNSAKLYKDKLMNRIITAYPWMTIDSKFDYPYSKTGIEYAEGGDTITLGVSKNFNISWFPKEIYNDPDVTKIAYKLYGFNPYTNINFDLETEFNTAILALSAYAKENCPYKLDYDFKNEFGTPIKIFDNFIQIGYDIIPIESGSLNYITPKVKKNVINLIIKIKNRGLY